VHQPVPYCCCFCCCCVVSRPAGTFTKSFGSAGGYIAGSKQLIAYLRRHCPAHLYATSMAPGVAQQIISAIWLMQGEDGTDRGARKIRQLKDNSNYFRWAWGAAVDGCSLRCCMWC
jgi:7-keto-8-aminopelargonate synthetase-like enzyme